jgi:hypothetical protein
MKIVRILVVIATLSMGLQKSYSQAAILAIIFGDQVASEEFNLSLELGGNFSTVSNFTNMKRTNETNFGIGCNFKLSEHFYLSPSVFFLSKRKFKFTSYSLNTGNDNIDNEFMNKSGNGNFNYIDVPVLLWYEINKIRLGLGPQVSFLTKSNLVFNGEYGDFTQDLKNNTNNLDYGIMASVGYEFGKARKGKGIFIQARYYQGFADVYNDQISPQSNQGSYFSFHVSLPFITDELANKNLQAN